MTHHNDIVSPDTAVPPVAPDRTRSAENRPRKRLLSRVAGIATGAAVGVVVAELGLRFGGSMQTGGLGTVDLEPWQTWAVLAMCGMAIPLVLLVHEVGHLLGGRLVGFRAFLLIVGPMRLERSEAGWSLHLNKEIGLYGGLAGSTATDAQNLRSRTAVMVAAGPVASVVLALGAWITARSLDLMPFTTATSFASVATFFMLQTLAVLSAGIALATLIPMQTSGYLSDGARLWRLWRGGPVAARDSAIQAIMGRSLSGVRPRDWDSALLNAATALDDDSMFAFIAAQFAQMHAADRGDVAHALEQMEVLLQRVEVLPKMMRPGIHLEAARQFALAGRVEAARAQVALVKGPIIGAPYLKDMAEVAMLVAEGRDAEASVLLPTIRPMLARSMDRGSARWLSDVLDTLEATLVSRASDRPNTPLG